MRRILIVVLVLLLGGVLGTQGYAWYHLRAGRTALEHYRNAEARRHLDACLSIWSKSETAHLLAARAARRTGDFDAAEDHIRACQTGEGKESDAVHLEWALLQASKGDLLAVEEYLQTRAAKDEAAHDYTSAAVIWEALVEGNTRMYRAFLAMNILDNWLEKMPDDPRAHFLRGNLYRQLASSKATADYRRVVELDPDNDEARWWFAVSLQEGGQFDEALTHLEHLRSHGWPDPDLRPRIAHSLDRVGRGAEARKLLDEVLAENPDHPRALRVRGKIEFAAGNLPEAEKWLKEAIRVKSADYPLRYDLAQCLRQQEGKEAEAREQERVGEKLKGWAERLGEIRSREMSMKPHDPELHCLMGILYDNLDNPEWAERWLSSALHEDPNYRPGYAAFADFYERHHRRAGEGHRVPRTRARCQGARS